MNERKALVDSTAAFDVLLPEPWTGSPTLTFRRAGSTTAGAGFAVKRAADSITAIDGVELTGTFAAGVGMTGPVWGRAYLRTAQDGTFPVQVDRIETATIYISEPLPKSVIITAQLPASLIWGWFSAALPAAVTATETGDRPADWWVDYTADRGAAVGNLASQTVSGILHVVARRFSTGIGDEALTYYYGHTLPRAPTDAKSWAGPIEAARDQLVMHIRSRINATASGRREDDLNGADFAQAHAAWAASLIMQRSAPEFAATLMSQALAMANKALDAAGWYDPDGDGIGEQGSAVSKAALLVGFSQAETRAETPPNPFNYRRGRARS